MPQHAATIDGGRGILHYSTTDAIFRDLDGNPISMEFHYFCGPMFSKIEGDGGYMPDEDTPEWHNLWKQFYGWWEAKGKCLYGKDRDTGDDDGCCTQ